MKKINKSIFYKITLFISFLCLLSCTNPLKKLMLQQVKDELPPSITILSPEAGDEYGAYTEITGIVADLSDEGISGTVAILSVEIVGIEDRIPITYDKDGYFSTIITTSGTGFSGDITLKFTALDWNGNPLVMTLGLEKAEGDFAGFSIIAGNKQAVISWDVLPGADSYTILDTRNQISMEGITGSDYLWDELTNGKPYSFCISTEINGETCSSSEVSIIPLALTTLTPYIESVYKGMNLFWQDIPGVSEYAIERAVDPEGPYIVREITSDSFFLDAELDKDSGYYYRIYPISPEEGSSIIKSSSKYGASGFFPDGIQEIGYCNTPGSAYDVAVQGTYAYVADGNSGLRIFNISNPTAPYEVGFLDPSEWGWSNGIDVSGDFVYLVEAGGLHMIDISDPSAPVETGSFRISGSAAYGVFVDNGYAYVAYGESGLRKIDLSNPQALSEDGYYNTDGKAFEVTVNDDLAYVADGIGGLCIINTETFSATRLDTAGTSVDVAYKNGFAYIADGTGDLCIINTSTSTIYTLAIPGESEGIAVNGDLVYVAEKSGDLHIFDISNPTSPLLRNKVPTPGNSIKVTVIGGYTYVANSYSGVRIIDSSIPSETSESAFYSTPAKARGVAIRGNFAYVVEDSSVMHILNIADPSNPVKVGSCHVLNGSTFGIAVSGNYAYIADSSGSSLRVIDVSSPSSPYEVGRLHTPDSCIDIAIRGDYAYVAGYEEGLFIIDISNPLSPSEVSVYDTPERAWGIEVSGDYAYVADQEGGLRIIDISNPELPREVGSYEPMLSARDVVIKGDYAFVSDWESNLLIINISNPTAPVVTYTFPVSTSGAPRIALLGSYLYVPNCSSALQIFDISNPAIPLEVGSFNTPFVWTIAVDRSNVYLTIADDFITGLNIVDLNPGQ
jgi:hypothetical protein